MTIPTVYQLGHLEHVTCCVCGDYKLLDRGEAFLCGSDHVCLRHLERPVKIVDQAFEPGQRCKVSVTSGYNESKIRLSLQGTVVRENKSTVTVEFDQWYGRHAPGSQVRFDKSQVVVENEEIVLEA